MKKITVFLLCMMSFISVFAGKNPNPPPRHSRHFDWQRAEGERQKMREHFRNEHQKYINTLKDFHKRYAAETDPAKKEAIRAELQSFIAGYFNKQIEYSKKRIAEMKSFVERLEADQKTMEENMTNIVSKRTDAVLQGNFKPPRKNPPQQQK